MNIKTAYFLLFASTAYGGGISHVLLDSNEIIPVVLSQQDYTSISFPSQFSMAYGLGIVFKSKDTKEEDVQGSVGGYYTPGKPVIVLYALQAVVNTKMTVVMDGQFYVFQLTSTGYPDIALTLVDNKALQATSVTEKQVVEHRPKYDAELMLALVNLAKNAKVLRSTVPEQYANYEQRKCSYHSGGTTTAWRTEVREIHRFVDQDAIVIIGEITNTGDTPLMFSRSSMGIGLPNSKTHPLYPVSFLDCQKPVLPHSTEPFAAELVGGLDFTRSAISAENEFRLIVEAPGGQIPAQTPTPTPTPTAKP